MSLRTVDLIGGFSNSVEAIRDPRIENRESRFELWSADVTNHDLTNHKKPGSKFDPGFLKFYPAGAV